ncbi:MAG TPA: helix-turn-helix domain-containing protein, partial [Streptosporangiaceae bacterium]|nr:helix-turn-helix domain-containing protein [Streptosporangiaceae bacterium]
MTASQAPLPPVPLPIRPRPRRGETTESYARRLAHANHLRPSYLRAFLCDPPRRTGAIRPWRLAAISGRSVRALQHALAGLTQRGPPARQPRVPGSVRTLISTWLLTEPELTPAQIWQRLLDEHDAGISYTTIGHYRRSIINSNYRLNAAFRAGSDDSNQPQSPITTPFTRTSHPSPIASQIGPARSEPQPRADLSGTGQRPVVSPGGSVQID